jgi:hypothetical protein
MSLKKRLAALERRLNMTHSLQVLIIEGGLPPGEPLWAVAGPHEWLRQEGEDLEAFANRVAQAARDLKEQLLVLGGLPSNPAQGEIARAAYEAWLQSGHDDVPPEELARIAPNRRGFLPGLDA